MIYLDNTTSAQTIWIPRNDGDGNIYVPHTYQEGYEDGIEHQKSLLSSTAFTENGEYQREDGWSAITVNVTQSGSVLEGKEIVVSQDVTIVVPTSGYDGFSAVTVDATEYGQTNYDSGFDDGYTDGYSSGASEGYDSGYTSGETHQKSLLVSTAITQNGSYSRENGYSAITVNVPNTSVLGNGSFTANGYYYAAMDNLDGYSMVTVNVPKDEVTWIDLDYEMAFKDITIMPLYYNVDYLRNVHISCNDMVNSARTDGQNDIISTFTAVTATTNGAYGSSASPLSSITVNVPQTSGVYGAKTITTNGTYSASTDNFDGYSAITVNVPTSGETEIVMVTTGWCWFDTDYTIHYGDSIEIEHCTFGKSGIVQGRHQQYVGGNQSELFRIGENENYLYLKYFNNFSSAGRVMPLPSSGSLIEDKTINFSSTGFVIDGNVITSYTTTELASTARLIFFADTNEGNDSITGQTAKMGVVRIYGSDGTLKATFKPMLDEFNVPFFKYVEEDIDIYAIGSGTPSYEIIDPSYDSGYTSGYTDGQNSIISTFITMTATTNGVYGSSANPLSSITVNVPTSGGSGSTLIFYADYIHTETLSANTYEDYIDTGLFPTNNITFRVKGYRKGIEQGNRIVGWCPSETTYSDNDDFRLFWINNGDSPYFDWGYDRIYNASYFDSTSGYTDITCGNYYVYDNVEEQTIVSGNAKSIYSLYSGGTIRVDVGSWWLQSLEIYDGNTLLFDGRAAYDENGNIGLYDSVSKTLKTAITNKQMVYEYDSSQDYQSGYTDGYNSGYTEGYNSGYTEGQNVVISTFSSITITQNGQYGDITHPMSSITVNVPQSGMDINTLATRNYNISNPTITTNISSSAFQNSTGVTGQLTLNDSVSQIVTEAFYNSGINSIVWPSVTCYLRGNQIFAYSRLQGELVIPQNIVFNGTNGTFGNCTGLTSIVFNVSNGNSGIIEANTFANCTNVTAITLYNCYNSINGGAFYNCSSLAVINSHSSTAPSLGSDTFEDVPSTGTVHYPQGSDYSSWQSNTYLSGWTFVGDL